MTCQSSKERQDLAEGAKHNLDESDGFDDDNHGLDDDDDDDDDDRMLAFAMVMKINWMKEIKLWRDVLWYHW